MGNKTFEEQEEEINPLKTVKTVKFSLINEKQNG